MHMPGHKRNTGAFPWLEGLAERDITEIEGFDNLNAPEAEFAAMERAAAKLWGADESVALVNGGTIGVLASVLSALDAGGELLMCRASHLSVYHAAQLGKVMTRRLTAAADADTGIPLSTTPEEVAAALDMYPAVRLVCVTSPTYEGVISDTAAIAAVCHARGVPLLVDEAHGAHLGFSCFPKSSVAGGADMVVQSLHKTLPALTQTALLHINGGLVDPEKVRRYAAMLQTSSPSYLLSTSIEKCVEYLVNHGEEAAERWLRILSKFREGAERLQNIRLWRKTDGVFAYDPSKLLLAACGDLGGRLRRDFRIEPEYARGDLTLCMTGMGDTEETLDRLLSALLTLDPDFPPYAPAPRLPAPPPRQAMAIHKAAALPGKLLPLSAAEGRVSGEYAWRYPPGVPSLVPGEIVDGNVIRALSGVSGVHFSRKHAADSIFCVDLP